jgi:hypothetical protein
MTMERVNLAYLWMAYLAIPVGAVAVARRLGRAQVPVAALAVLAGVLVCLPQPGPNGPQPFARGLYGDLDAVAATPTTDSYVVAYHFMSHFYVHDRLVNEGPPGHTFHVLRERDGDRSLYDDVDAQLRAAGWTPGSAVWCVIPMEVGPESAGQACHVQLPGLTQRVELARSRSTVIGWLPADAVAPTG